jgi:hypothetical protein
MANAPPKTNDRNNRKIGDEIIVRQSKFVFIDDNNNPRKMGY